MTFEFINNTSKYLEQVIDLGNKNAKTLGFLPEGGFIDHAKKRWIVIARKNDEVLGYLLYRLGRKNLKVSITHLCVKENSRGQDISTKLINQIRNKYQNIFTGISLSCREDYNNASKLWERYGFVRKNRVRSRSAEEHYLIKWWYDFNKLDLFSLQEKYSEKLKVLLDANILIKLRDNISIEYNEVKSLQADWLVDEVDYYFAQEMHNEICRDKDKSRADKTRGFIRNFHEVKCDREKCKLIENELLTHLKGDSTNDISDRKQLAECIASGINYFITGDRPLLSKTDIIQEEYGVLILSPLEFLLEIDQLRNSDKYNPVRLSGSIHVAKSVNNRKLENLIDRFLKKRLGESKVEFKTKVESIVLNSKESNIKMIINPQGEEIAFYGLQLLPSKIQIPFLRVKENSLSATLFTQIITDIIDIAISKDIHEIELKEKFIDHDIQTSLEARGFFKENKIWKKLALKGLIPSEEILNNSPGILKQIDSEKLDHLFSKESSPVKQSILYEIERMLFPLKFSDLELPCYIIPIRPYWASQLFDKINASQLLFGASPEKIWNRENVYYRSIKPVTEKIPARILWYSSTEKGFDRQKSIVAVSYLDNMTIDKVKVQFKKYKKYGIYSWEDIYKLAKEDIENEVKALIFSETEVFVKAIPFKKINDVLLCNGRRKNTFASPVEVNYKTFNDLYKLTIN